MPFLGSKQQVDELNTTMQKNRWAQRKSKGPRKKSLLDDKIVTVLKKFLSKCFEVPPGKCDSQ